MTSGATKTRSGIVRARNGYYRAWVHVPGRHYAQSPAVSSLAEARTRRRSALAIQWKGYAAIREALDGHHNDYA